jgi:hypothetical protein
MYISAKSDIYCSSPGWYTRIKWQPVTVAVRSEAWVSAGWLLGSWVRIPLKAWMYVRGFLCCIVLCRWRPCDGLITHPRSPTVCLNSPRNLLHVKRPRSFKDSRATGKKKIFCKHYMNQPLLLTNYCFYFYQTRFDSYRAIIRSSTLAHIWFKTHYYW